MSLGLRTRFPVLAEETAFRRDFNEAALGQVRLAGGLAILLYAAFGLLDVVVAPEGVAALLLIRAVVIAYTAFIVVSTYVLRPDRRNMLQQVMVCSVVVVASAGLDLMPLIADVPTTYATTGTLLVLMFLFGFARVRVPPALVTSALLVVIYAISLALQDLPATEIVYNAFFLLGFLAVGTTTCHALERLRRREYRYQQALRTVFGSYVGAELVDLAVSTQGGVIEGEERDVTLMFADIRDFTSLAERCEAHEVVGYLNDFYATVLPILETYGGHANKLMGDGLMAAFGAPQSLPLHADRALEAAVAIVQAVSRRFGEDMRIGVGLNSGLVVAGTVGGPSKLDYTLIGDAVNIASRVEQLTKVTGDGVLFTEETRARLSAGWRTTSRGTHVVKGKARPMELHTVDVVERSSLAGDNRPTNQRPQ